MISLGRNRGLSPIVMYATMNSGRVHMPETAENQISDEERDQL